MRAIRTTYCEATVLAECSSDTVGGSCRDINSNCSIPFALCVCTSCAHCVCTYPVQYGSANVCLMCMVCGVISTGHAMVSPAGTDCDGPVCVESYDLARPNIEISNRIGYHPQNANRPGINKGCWRVTNSAGTTNTIYTCNISSCVATARRTQFDIGTLAFMGDYGSRVNITDLKSLDSTLKLVYSIEPVTITASNCRYSAQTAVTYSFEGERGGSACVRE